MSYLIDLPTFIDERGSLTVVEKKLPFNVRRFYYICNVKGKRGGHRHKKNIQALICIGGSCEIYINNKAEEKTILLDSSKKCLILEPEDWHTMENFSKGSILLVMASEYYDVDDYIDQPY